MLFGTVPKDFSGFQPLLHLLNLSGTNIVSVANGMMVNI